MHKRHGQLYYSPSDLTRYMESPFASWMDRFALECPQRAPQRDPVDSLSMSLSEKGLEHEQSLEMALRKQGMQVVKIMGQSASEKYAHTLHCMRVGCDVIVQARLEHQTWGGYADFLLKVLHQDGDPASLFGDYHYEVWDTKLTRQLKPSFVIQLCCYAQMLESIQGILPEFITVALGNGENKKLNTQDYYAYYQSLMASFHALQQNFSIEDRPDPSDSKNWLDWSQFAEQLLVEKDHLSQVANITRGQIKKLNQAGIHTMKQLADFNGGYVSGIHSDSLIKLKTQAQIQKHSQGLDVPKYKIITPKAGEKMGLALLPPHSSLDVFFDIEGYPLVDGGLEYLWGSAYFEDVKAQKQYGPGKMMHQEPSKRQFIDFWAHDELQEKHCFQRFIAWVYQRWQTDPTMHIYHYAHYEIAACRKLMGRYGVCEYEVDQLLRHEVFVDLYKIVKGGLFIGEERYSIKNVEHLYRARRATEVASGGDSVVVYEQWRQLNQLGEQGDNWQTSSLLKQIRDYNSDDCYSTQELVDWLRQQQAQHAIVYQGAVQSIEPELKEEITERIALRDRLLNQAERERDTDLKKSLLTENLAWTLEYHRREAKPIFWRLFERLGLGPMELMDDLDCLAGCERTARAAFKPTPRARNLAYEYRFDPTQEFKAGASQFYILGVEAQEDNKPLTVQLIADESDLTEGLIVLQAKQEPPPIISLIPNEYVNPNPIPSAIDQCVQAYENGTLQSGQSAIIDFLTRSKPKFKGRNSTAMAPSTDARERLQQITQAIRDLDHSYLPIQGPPGAGKSYTARYVIAQLVQSGARIGITSNSHKAINHLLLSTAKFCQQSRIDATFACTKDTEPDLEHYRVAIIKNNELVRFIQPGCVIGTTAWGFARSDMINQLDYLFVDEAGQVAVANLIAMSRCATNLVLMGDQMQLGQPSQGTHPGDSGLCVLDYLLHETPTIPEDMGVFLNRTYRMHPKINQFISTHFYQGKLHAHGDTKKRFIEVPKDYQGLLTVEAGIVFAPVPHLGNVQASDEEVAVIKELAHSLLGRVFHTTQSDLKSRPIGWQDMLFVAPYNHQVSKLRSALGEHAKVGSVDKFQGQEAAIVFLSMCTSDASESPRGLDFLLDPHRINVAISRAQALVVVVANPTMAHASVGRVDQLMRLNVFHALMACGGGLE